MKTTTLSWKSALFDINAVLKENTDVSASARHSIMEELRRDSVARRLGEQAFMVCIVNGEIEIYFGPRDWGFNTRTGELLGVGTYLGG